jgi:hypothetical protein
VGPATEDGPADVEDADESLYKGLLSAFLSSLGDEVAEVRYNVSGESRHNPGRPDLTFEFGALAYVFELKMSDGPGECLSRARAGMAQIDSRAYAAKFMDRRIGPVLVSLAIDRKARNIGACVFRKDGEETELLFGKPSAPAKAEAGPGPAPAPKPVRRGRQAAPDRPEGKGR